MCIEESIHVKFNESNHDIPKEREEDAGNLETAANPAYQIKQNSKIMEPIQQDELEE